jgi:hypothetical protein
LQKEAEKHRPKKVDVGWFIEEPQGKFVFPEPKKLFGYRKKPLSNRAVQSCPAVNELERELFVLQNPFDITLRCSKTEGNIELHVVEDGTRIDDDLISRFVFLMEPKLWRSPNIPVIQIKIPYFFLSDEPCYMTQIAPFMSNNMVQWPGILIGGHLPINIWPRILNWAFEWTNLENDLTLRRGDHLCYFKFDSENLRTSVNMFELEYTSELQEYRKGISATPKFMSNTFSLFETAYQRRPKKLLKRKY